MIVLTEIRDVREHLRAERFAAAKEGRELQVGFVPTMGYLHEGHASLLRSARMDNDLVVLSIFVNPIQFGPNEDFDRYPRDRDKDMALAKREGVDIVFLPSVDEMYPQPTKTKVHVAELTDHLCGAARPGHFDGVTTVVSKLLNIVAPDRAYFGQKDAQQVAVITQMVQDLNMDVEIVPCPIVREEDGLALSSRNVYLSPEQRQASLVISRSLRLAEQMAREKESATAGDIASELVRSIEAEPTAVIDYADIRRFPSLESVPSSMRVKDADGKLLIAAAVKFGATRLIDNVILTMEGDK
ncbi:pantoate--beta-alanine ligase [Paenibacillus sp. FSL W8-0186]|uniref:Pantothenate synthetase n=1 Tax=Paenibacillus woosongensis TaxID=307580 RepID=A0ABQ4MQE6_9BACL|nr:pantoate--beta-alanine ligase [Paenibacillus woosongensis]GIP58233.1 pantoate--beta-alanine ligase [Paenibacillus woosongensis]